MKCEIIKCENEATATYAYTSNRYNFCEKCGAGQQEFKEKDLPTSSVSDELACSMRDNFAMSADDSHVDRLVNCENFCENCKEVDCVCSTDETCSMIREYLRLKEFHSSVGCLFAEGVEFMTKVEIYDAIKSDFQKTMPISSIGS